VLSRGDLDHAVADGSSAPCYAVMPPVTTGVGQGG
jgi:hypothetical protein